MIVCIQRWTDQRARQEVFAAMQGEAARAVQDIDVEDPNSTLDFVLDLYESRFVTVSDSKMAHMDFLTARQMDDETLLQWHARLCDLYMRAYPGMPLDGPGGTMRLLREQFAMGIANEQIRVHVLDQNPVDYARVLAAAQNKQATLMMNEHAKGDDGGNGKSKRVSAIEDPCEIAIIGAINAHMKGKCHLCNKDGHFQSYCPEMKKVIDFLRGQYTIKGSFRPDSAGLRPAYQRHATTQTSSRPSGGHKKKLEQRPAPGARFATATANPTGAGYPSKGSSKKKKDWDKKKDFRKVNQLVDALAAIGQATLDWDKEDPGDDDAEADDSEYEPSGSSSSEDEAEN